MKKTFYTTLAMLLMVISFSVSSFAQFKLQEGFETSDTLSGSAPAGWSVWKNTSFPIERVSNWTVRDSGRIMPGLEDVLTKSRSGKKSFGVSWRSGLDSVTGNFGIADGWVVSKRINITTGDSLRFFVSGGATTFSDSMQVWVSVNDSMPTSFTGTPQNRLGSTAFPVGSVYGNFVRKAYSLNAYAGQTVWIGFRYFMNIAVNGFAVYLDDVAVGQPVVGIEPNTSVPDKFALEQNYPNPFNPTTNIRYDLPKATNVQIVIYNSMGQEVKSLVNEFKNPGSYSVDFNASSLSSGTYFYKIITSDFTETKKMTLVK